MLRCKNLEKWQIDLYIWSSFDNPPNLNEIRPVVSPQKIMEVTHFFHFGRPYRHGDFSKKSQNLHEGYSLYSQSNGMKKSGIDEMSPPP